MRWCHLNLPSMLYCNRPSEINHFELWHILIFWISGFVFHVVLWVKPCCSFPLLCDLMNNEYESQEASFQSQNKMLFTFGNNMLCLYNLISFFPFINWRHFHLCFSYLGVSLVFWMSKKSLTSDTWCMMHHD